MAGDELKLLRWQPEEDCPWVAVDGDEDTVRPTGIVANFLAGDLMAAVYAVGDEHGVRIVKTELQLLPLGGIDGGDAALEAGAPAGEIIRTMLNKASGPIRAEDIARFDPMTAAAALEAAAVIGYDRDPDGRPSRISFGGGPALRIQDVRRWLAGPEGGPKPGPKRKASIDQAAKVWKAATRKGNPPARAVAEALDVSMPTAHRYIAAARKAGLIEEKS